ncbi:acyl carrier protein [Stigmatella aurantiaca]|uniref:acyl carrier protein n=1 Tax=Stigmatella aurantiaca TaxID=41 RepID=UPI003B28D97F
MLSLCSAAATVLGLPPSAPIDPRRPLQELGLDSLMALQFRNSLAASLGALFPPRCSSIIRRSRSSSSFLREISPPRARHPLRSPGGPSSCPRGTRKGPSPLRWWEWRAGCPAVSEVPRSSGGFSPMA